VVDQHSTAATVATERCLLAAAAVAAAAAAAAGRMQQPSVETRHRLPAMPSHGQLLAMEGPVATAMPAQMATPIPAVRVILVQGEMQVGAALLRAGSLAPTIRERRVRKGPPGRTVRNWRKRHPS
jgi:hypothetical protein